MGNFSLTFHCLENRSTAQTAALQENSPVQQELYENSQVKIKFERNSI